MVGTRFVYKVDNICHDAHRGGEQDYSAKHYWDGERVEIISEDNYDYLIQLYENNQDEWWMDKGIIEQMIKLNTREDINWIE